MAYGVPPRRSTSSSACRQESRKPMSKPAGSSRTSAPMTRLSRMLPTWVLTGSVQSGTQFSCTSTQSSPRWAATAAT